MSNTAMHDMRLPPVSPAELPDDLRVVHDGIADLVAHSQERITVLDAHGALIGPFPAMLRFPRFGVPALLFHRALATEARLPKSVREVAILTVGAVFGARYQLYAHRLTAAAVGLSPSQIAALSVGGRPAEMTAEEAIAHDVARSLASGGVLPAATYARAIDLLGPDGVGELTFLIGGYCTIAVLLNAFDVPVPDAAS